MHLREKRQHRQNKMKMTKAKAEASANQIKMREKRPKRNGAWHWTRSQKIKQKIGKNAEVDVRP